MDEQIIDDAKNPFRTLVWRPGHKNHNFLKAGIYNIYQGRMYMYKCDRCGDVKIRMEQPLKKDKDALRNFGRSKEKENTRS